MSILKTDKINIDRYFAFFDATMTSQKRPPHSLPVSDDQPCLLKPYEHRSTVRMLERTLTDSELQQAAVALSELKGQLLGLPVLETCSLVPQPLAADLQPPAYRRRWQRAIRTGALLGLVGLGLPLLIQYSPACETYQLCQESQGIMATSRQQVQAAAAALQQRLQQRGSTLHPTPPSPPVMTEEADPHYQRGLEQAYDASVRVQTAKTADEWMQAVNQWEEAIAAMAAVNPTSQEYDQAQAKLQEYTLKQSYALAEVDSFREAVNAAMAAAIKVQTASTPQAWQSASADWIEAIRLMQEVAPTSRYYDLAQQKITEYARNLAYSQALSVVSPQ